MRGFFTKTIEVQRLATADNKQTYTANGSITGYISPLSAEDTFISDGNPAQGHKLVTDAGSDVKSTDRLICEGDTYIVSGVQRFGFGAMRRLEALLEKLNS